MTEQEWLTGGHLTAMWRWVTCDGSGPGEGPNRVPVSDRKLHLWACAVERDRMLQRSGPQVPQDAWDERLASLELAEKTYDAGGRGRTTGEWFWERDAATIAAGALAEPLAAVLLREVVGNPWRRRPAADPAWLAWNGRTVPRLAQAVHDSRDWSRLPVLADALEEAGCDDEDVVLHCRGLERCPACLGDGLIYLYEDVDAEFGHAVACDACRSMAADVRPGFIALRGPHCLGCWVIDLLLGKG